MAIENRLQDLVEAATNVGSNEDEVLVSVIELADNLILAARSNEDLGELLQVIRLPQ